MNAARELQTLTEALAAALGRRLTEHDGQLVSAAATLEVARQLAEIAAALRTELGGIFEALAPLPSALRDLTAAGENIADATAKARESLDSTNF
ncbi:hypothetical protein [Extensimonas perlucida]|uniref:hypothetical protein n=1 Tax=Extensimonas perlucida TaxID=2590786 RepID=UPI0011A493CA|nr:hypothetical protein [Extensimonas perlucida]